MVAIEKKTKEDTHANLEYAFLYTKGNFIYLS